MSQFAWNILTIFLLFAIGAYGILSRRNMLKILIGLEIMSKSAMLGFVVAGKLTGNLYLGQALTSIVIIVDAAIAAILLALIVNAYKHYGRIDVKKLTRLRG